jgi:hypothetical protein
MTLACCSRGISSLLTTVDGWVSAGPLRASRWVTLLFAEDLSPHLAGIPA